MLTDAVPALLRIRAVAALVLQRAGYDHAFITDRLGATTTIADPADCTPELLAAASHYLMTGLGCPGCGIGAITYYRVGEVIAEMGGQLAPPRPVPEARPEPEAWDHGVLFDMCAGVP